MANSCCVENCSNNGKSQPNLNFYILPSNKNVPDFLDIIYFTNVLPNITSPTRLTSHSQTLIDNILSIFIMMTVLQAILFPQYLTTMHNY